MLHCEHLHNPTSLDELSTAWEELFDNCNAEPSTSFEWTKALLETHLSPTDKFFITILKDDDTPVGILPFIIREISKGGIGFRVLMPISELYNTHSDLLIRDYSAEIVQLLLTSLLSLKEKWDIFRMSHMLENHPFLLTLPSSAPRKVRFRTTRTEPTFFIPLDKTFEEYWNSRSRKFRANLRRMTRKLEKKGEISFVQYFDLPTLSKVYDDLLTIEKRSWKHKHGTAISSIPKQEQFYWLLCQGAADKKRLHINFLFLKKQPIAYNIGLISNKSYKYLKSSYDAVYRPCSPSTVLRAHLIEDLIREGVQEFDFHAEPYEWEAQWSKDLKWQQSVIIYNKTTKARMFALYNWIKNNILNKKKASTLNYHDPLATRPDT
jgi:CelD/BcsL family acetyltransferase involved in cellulose biosynthesis